MSRESTDRGVEVAPDEEEAVEEVIDDLEELEATADSDAERRLVRRAIHHVAGLAGGRVFGVDDLAQQVVGAFVLSAPFVVTEEVWALADAMNYLQWVITVFIVFAIGYGTLYRADEDREADAEESVVGLPVRFVSLVAISYLSVAVLAFVFDAPDTFDATATTTAKAVCIGAVFSVVGAATADSLF